MALTEGLTRLDMIDHQARANDDNYLKGLDRGDDPALLADGRAAEDPAPRCPPRHPRCPNRARRARRECDLECTARHGQPLGAGGCPERERRPGGEFSEFRIAVDGDHVTITPVAHRSERVLDIAAEYAAYEAEIEFDEVRGNA